MAQRVAAGSAGPTRRPCSRRTRVGRRRGARERRGVAHPRARRRPQGVDAPRGCADDSGGARGRRARACERSRVPHGRRAWIRRRLSSRRGGEPEPLPLLASDGHGGDVRRRGRRRFILRLDAEQMLDALGSAGTQAAGLWEFNADGAMSKRLHPGKAAFNGVLSADLARAGFTGATRILEGERGFFRATSTSADPAASPTAWARGGRSARTATSCTRAAATRTRRSTSPWTCAGAAAGPRSMRCASWPRVEIETYGPGYEIVKE